MQTHGGKGSTQRPVSNRKQYEDNWDRIFGRPKLKLQKDQTYELDKKTKELEKELNNLGVS